MHPMYKSDIFGIPKKEKGKPTFFEQLFSGKGFKEGVDGFCHILSLSDSSDLNDEHTSYWNGIRYGILSQVQREGHILIEADKLDWESKISEKTFKNMDLSAINFPFRAGLIGFSEDEFLSFYIEPKEKEGASETKRWIHFTRYSEEKGHMSSSLDLGASIGESFDKFQDWYIPLEKHDKKTFDELDTFKSSAYTIISILLYIASFRKSVSLVREDISQVPRKIARKANIPSHAVRKIILTPNVNAKGYKNDGSPKGSGKSIGEGMTWLTRGHFRNQYYSTSDTYRLKWIEPFWKGSGKNEMERVYSVSK